MRPLTYLAIPTALLAAACERQPVAPDQGVRPRFAATHTEVTGSFTEVDGPADCTADPRIGEIVLFTGLLNYVMSTNTSSSGNADTTLKFSYDPAVHLVGQTSGRVWMIDPTSTQPMFKQNVHRDGLTTKITEHEFYRGADGAHLQLMVNWRVTVNANGSVTATRDFVYTCIGG